MSLIFCRQTSSPSLAASYPAFPLKTAYRNYSPDFRATGMTSERSSTTTSLQDFGQVIASVLTDPLSWPCARGCQASPVMYGWRGEKIKMVPVDQATHSATEWYLWLWYKAVFTSSLIQCRAKGSLWVTNSWRCPIGPNYHLPGGSGFLTWPEKGFFT